MAGGYGTGGEQAMRLTNHYDLPPAIYQAVSGMTRKPEPYVYHPTELINNPLIRFLKMRHWDELEEDASDRLWALLGSACHAVLQKAGDILNALAEEQLRYGIDGCSLVMTGTPDIYIDHAIEDYKVTSVYAFLLGAKIEWERQLNIYAFMFTRYGFDVKHLRIHAILRDWMRSKALYDRNYPKIPFHTLNVRKWSTREQEAYVLGRINLFKSVDDGVVIPTACTDEERWARPTTWAVMKGRGKKAVRVFNDEETARKYIGAKGDQSEYRIEERPGQYIRCEGYCPVRAFCKYNPYREVSDD
jgi:hypothetical protein